MWLLGSLQHLAPLTVLPNRHAPHQTIMRRDSFVVTDRVNNSFMNIDLTPKCQVGEKTANMEVPTPRDSIAQFVLA